jgi:hypothetical protein
LVTHQWKTTGTAWQEVTGLGSRSDCTAFGHALCALGATQDWHFLQTCRVDAAAAGAVSNAISGCSQCRRHHACWYLCDPGPVLMTHKLIAVVTNV